MVLVKSKSDTYRAAVMLLDIHLCARHGTSLTGESPVTGIYRQV